MCYRDSLKAGFKQSLNEELKNEIMADNVYGNFKKNFKILDYCRALHAEENAIVNVAKSGSTQLGKDICIQQHIRVIFAQIKLFK